MGIKGHINEVSRRAKPDDRKKGNIFSAKANRIHAKPETPKKDILNAIASRHQAPKAAAPQTAPKTAPKRPNRGM